MKLVVLSESAEDEAAVRILVDGILGTHTEYVVPPFRASGWSQFLNVLPTVLRKLHYHTDADALVVIVDSDDSTPHQLAHIPSDGANQGCRLCKLRLLADQVQKGLTQIPNRAPLKAAFGVAIPALEAPRNRSGVGSEIGCRDASTQDSTQAGSLWYRSPVAGDEDEPRNRRS